MIPMERNFPPYCPFPLNRVNSPNIGDSKPIMNERHSRPVPETSSDAGDQNSENPSGSEDSPEPSRQFETPGRELMVIEPKENGNGWFTRFMIRLGLRSGGTLRDDLNEALSGQGEAGDVFSPEERAMLQNILRLRERRVEDVMVPRAEVHAVGLDATLGELLHEFKQTGHSRLPVYGDTLDDPRGMVLIKDLLLHMTKISAKKNGKQSKAKKSTKESDAAPLDFSKVDLTLPLSKLKAMRKVLFVPPSMLAADLMARMQTTRTQMALVIDEYGGTDGLVTLEDIVEEVVGEIEDEHDDEEADGQQIETLGDGVWTVDGRVELENLIREIGPGFNPGKRAEDVDTLGGLVLALSGHVPVRGEVVTGLPGYEFRVLDADLRRIRKLQIVQTSLRDKRRRSSL